MPAVRWLNWFGAIALLTAVIWLLRGVGILGGLPGLVLYTLLGLLLIVALAGVWGVGRQRW